MTNAWAREAVAAHYAKISKYRACPTTVDGIRFASKKEAGRYEQLKLLQSLGDISELAWQVRYSLKVNDLLVTTYVLDFSYRDKRGVKRYEDVKGFTGNSGAYNLFRVKAKLMLAVYGILVEEV